MRDVDRDEWNAGFEIPAGDLGRDRFVGLELECEIQVLTDQMVAFRNATLG
jgi:hypothetical protein